MSIQCINNLAEFICWVEGTRPKDDIADYVMFYRGHSDASYKIEPTVYRAGVQGETFRAVEHHLYEEMLRHSPASFAEDRNLFERIVRMQHHGLPTRLLDLTHSPLVALYFACNSHAAQGEVNGKDGEVIFFSRKRKDVIHSSDIPECALAGIEKAIDFPSIISQIAQEMEAYFDASLNLRIESSIFGNIFYPLMQEWGASMRSLHDFNDLIDVVNKLNAMEVDVRSLGDKARSDALISEQNIQDLSEKLSISNSRIVMLESVIRFNEQISRLIIRVCEQLRINRSVGTWSLAGFLIQFVQYYFVLPPMNNVRIRQQQGAFIIFPLGRTNHWALGEVQPELWRVRVSAVAKDMILRELSYLGINQSFIYPDLNSIAADAKINYRASFEDQDKVTSR